MPTSQTEAVQVLVVGAGPVGLTLAGALARQGVACRIIDKLPAPSNLSKALAVQPRTLEWFERLGFVDQLVAAGHKVHGLDLVSDGKRVVRLDLDEIDSRYNFVLSLPQSATERFLGAYLEGLGVSVERGSELVNLTQDQDGAEAWLRRSDGSQARLRVRWVVGCDGAHSAVRRALDIPFEGKAFDEAFALADVRLDGDVADDEVSVRLHRGNFVILIPMPGERFFRIVVEHPAMSAPEGEPDLEEIQRALDACGLAGVRARDPVWLSRFHISQRQVGRYRHGRVFLAGDAAHVHSPLGGQGMNAGIQDACNLAWKLALACAGRGRPELLDTYQAERHPIGKALLHGTGNLTRIVTLRNPIAAGLRDRIAALLLSFDAVQDRVRAQLTQLGLNYRRSPIVAEDHEGGAGGRSPGWLHADVEPRAGDRAPHAAARRAADGETVRLFRLMAPTRHTLLLFAGRRAGPEDAARRQTVLEAVGQAHGDLIDSFLILPGAGPAPERARERALLDPDGAAHRAYNADDERLYLVRPDGYVGYRSQPADAGKLLQYLRQIFR
jgi:2-polyprenyl-6-methoxyphenol hydroxylase-like FAD-dependent oxidoreductase